MVRWDLEQEKKREKKGERGGIYVCCVGCRGYKRRDRRKMLQVLKRRPQGRQSHVWVKAYSHSNSKIKLHGKGRGNVSRKRRKGKFHHRPDGRRASRPATSKELARDQRLPQEARKLSMPPEAKDRRRPAPKAAWAEVSQPAGARVEMPKRGLEAPFLRRYRSGWISGKSSG